MYDVPNGEDEEEEFKILYDEAVFDPNNFVGTQLVKRNSNGRSD